MFTFCVTFATWCVLSGKFDIFHLSLGIVSCLIVSALSADMVLASSNIRPLPMTWLRFFRYIPWLLFQVFIANVHVMYLALHPRMMELIDPQIVRFKSKLKTDLALVTLANSITLTPGTITVYISVYGDVTFHMIDAESGQSLPWIMDARIAEVFGH
ncbi:MAG: Na+/H+ antiporter subunit E [Deltaproteobacteria bacterium]|nr:Na+/H+ antiporter subunit E [Deltaproteobacteria bacterium]MBW1962455.1 Na+/H+ antiporter subunit E [Deltaproteobacteria bacterium]MBW1993399.1 Na+/H+ antiporter subunit E [Deltaproteobacteria bacterium]MBW2153341.1 Na+/H+ antiporter subunit E [Deltaproteobacteria bacterium]